jgi:7,8-dihydropterin-6-yl-methyl-4-(beta-D-ribofuranosyl)aminobenzene 5'-phosphate synthase
MEIAPGLCSTGEVTGVVSEQSLVVETPQGAALLTGCAHPGLMKIVEAAGRCAGGPVKVVAGGFHLRDLDAEEVTAICRELHDRGVERASASHCTGEAQTQIIAEFFGEGWTPLGAGASVVIE